MTSDEGPRLTYLGTIQAGSTVVVVPRATLDAADARIAEARRGA